MQKDAENNEIATSSHIKDGGNSAPVAIHICSQVQSLELKYVLKEKNTGREMDLPDGNISPQGLQNGTKPSNTYGKEFV